MKLKNNTLLSIKIARFLPPAAVLLIFTLVYGISILTANPLFDDPDAAWHIIAGDVIRRVGHVPVANLWSFTTPDQKWYLISWLWDVMVSFIHSGGGPEAVFISTQVLIAFTMALLAWHMSKREGVSQAVAVIIAILAGICLHKFIMSRPQLAGYLFVVLCHLRLHQSRDDAGFRHLLWLPPIVILWINMHGSFLAVFALFAAYILEAAWRRQWQWFGRLSTIAALCLLVLPINPDGFELYDGVMHTIYSVMNQRIEDWMPFIFGEYAGLSLWLVLFILLSNFREPKVPLADKLLSAIWLLPMLQSKRHASIFILVSAPYMAINLQRFVDYAKDWRGYLAEYEHRMQMPAMRIGMAGLALAIVAISIGLIDDLRDESYLISPSFDSRPAIAWVSGHLAGKRVLNDYNFGGMIIYQSGGAFPVFVDGRAGTAYPEGFLTEYEAFEQFYKNWSMVLDKYHIDAIFISNSRPFSALYASGAKYEQWKLVYRDQVASVFVRKPAYPVQKK